jgi:acyl carrier protein
MADRIRSGLARQLGEQDGLGWLSDDEALTSAGIDSVVLIAVIAQIEQEIGHALPDDVVLEFATVGSLAEALQRRLE